MSQLNVDVIKNKAGTGGPTLQALTVTTDATVTGILTATQLVGIFSGSIYGYNTGIVTFAGITTHTAPIFGKDISLTGVVTATSFVGDVTGNVTGNINSSGVSTLTTLNGTSGLVSLGSTIKTKGFVETQSTVSIGGTILTLDASQGTVFTHTTSAQIGIVSFTGIRTDTAGSQTFTVLVTQGATPVNTTGAAGIGTQLASIRITPGNVGYSTHIKVGGGTSITLTNSAGALDLLTFIVSFDGATSIANTRFKVVGFAATDFRNAIV